MRANHHIFFLELRVASRINAGNIFGLHLRAGHDNTRMNSYAERKMRKRFIGIKRRENILERMAAPCKEYLGARRIKRNGQLIGWRKVGSRIAEFHARLKARSGDA